MTSIGKYIREHNWIAILALIAIGFALLWGSTYLEKSSVVYILMINLGAALIVSAIAMWILSHTGREVEKIVDKEVGGIHDEIKVMEDKLTNKLDILAEAKKCGVVHIFECRREDQNYKKELIKQLKDIEKQKEVLIMSNSLRDFFGPVHIKEYLAAIF
jgi:hypothetical protein